MAQINLDILAWRSVDYDVFMIEGHRYVIGGITDEIKRRVGDMSDMSVDAWRSIIHDWLLLTNDEAPVLTDRIVHALVPLFAKRLCA